MSSTEPHSGTWSELFELAASESTRDRRTSVAEGAGKLEDAFREAGYERLTNEAGKEERLAAFLRRLFNEHEVDRPTFLSRALWIRNEIAHSQQFAPSDEDADRTVRCFRDVLERFGISTEYDEGVKAPLPKVVIQLPFPWPGRDEHYVRNGCIYQALLRGWEGLTRPAYSEFESSNTLVSDSDEAVAEWLRMNSIFDSAPPANQDSQEWWAARMQFLYDLGTELPGIDDVKRRRYRRILRHIEAEKEAMVETAVVAGKLLSPILFGIAAVLLAGMFGFKFWLKSGSNGTHGSGPVQLNVGVIEDFFSYLAWGVAFAFLLGAGLWMVVAAIHEHTESQGKRSIVGGTYWLMLGIACLVAFIVARVIS